MDGLDVDDDDDFLDALFGGDDDEDRPPPRRTGRRIVAAVLLIALLALVIEPTTRLLRSSSPPGARNPSEIEGATADATLADRPGRTVTDGDWSLQIGSAVLIGATGPNCSGAITTVQGRRYITSARHCMEDFLDPALARDLSAGPGGEVREVTGDLQRAVEVFDPVTHRRIALVDRVAVGTGSMDLLVATTTAESGDYARRPARRVDRVPSVGDEVATFASSGADGFLPRRITGVYLGVFSFTGSGGLVHTVDLTGYRQPASSGLIGRGHSGHSPTGAGGAAFGPVLFSLNDQTPPDQRVAELRQMTSATGIDLAGAGFVGIDETLHLDAGDYRRLAEALRDP